MWLDSQIRALKPRVNRYRKVENIRRRGVGRLVVDIQPNGIKTFYFQYFRNGKRVLIKVGNYKQAGAGVTLDYARKQADKYGTLLQKGIDPEYHLDEQRIKEAERQREIEAAKYRGTFAQLIDSYLASLKDKASYGRVKQSLNLYVKDSFPELVKMYANEVTPEHIGLILNKMINKGITTQVNRVRSQLHAAFGYGIKQDNDYRRYEEEKVLFNLKANPVSSVPKQADFDKAGEHVIKDDDIRTIWDNLQDHYFLTGCAIKLALATGQRAGELIRLRQDDFNIDEGYLTIPANVSKNRTDHVVPLNDIALAVAGELFKEVEDASIYAFPGIKKGYYCEDIAIDTSTLGKQVRLFCDDENIEIEKFIPRDVRRTWKTLAGKAGITKELRDRIQNHSIQDVSTRHYDKYDYLKEKQEGMRVWNDYLDLIIHPINNVTHIGKSA